MTIKQISLVSLLCIMHCIQLDAAMRVSRRQSIVSAQNEFYHLLLSTRQQIIDIKKQSSQPLQANDIVNLSFTNPLCEDTEFKKNKNRSLSCPTFYKYEKI